MPEYIKILVVFLLVINVVTLFVYGMDKAASKRGQSQKHFGSAERKQFRTKSNRKAKRSAWRIPEMTLLLLAVIGGGAGAWATRRSPTSLPMPNASPSMPTISWAA